MNTKDKIEPSQYQHLLVEVAGLVQSHRIQAVQSVQTISNQLYWNIGELIIKKQQEFGWGNSVIESLSKDLPNLIGEGISWSTRNLQFMRQLVLEYSNVNQAASHLEISNVKPAVSHLDYIKTLVLNTPWKHNITIFQIEVEYALKSVNKPIGVSEYVLSKQLPKEFIGKLPTSEQFKSIWNNG
ncbi:DUF1016 N-terminal domain-containing protein [Flavobacterium sp.]|jgi:hypothetical protein|uniref:DUF1016 N-terminal domain-containing protein n=1 Tax=Flavobacterium sp. TaxID=239 RepID=UPI0037BE42E8